MYCAASTRSRDRPGSCELELPGAFGELCPGDLESPSCGVSWLTEVGVGAIGWLWVCCPQWRPPSLLVEALASGNMACEMKVGKALWLWAVSGERLRQEKGLGLWLWTS